jgi:hypothetical protein
MDGLLAENHEEPVAMGAAAGVNCALCLKYHVRQGQLLHLIGRREATSSRC